MEFSTRRVQRESVSLNYIDEGEGPAVLLGHGFPDSISLWRHQVPALLGAVQYASKAPTLGIWSTGDAYLVEEQMVAAGRFVHADWRYERVQDAGHWLMPDRPEHISRLLLNHLGQHHRVC